MSAYGYEEVIVKVSIIRIKHKCFWKKIMEFDSIVDSFYTFSDIAIV